MKKTAELQQNQRAMSTIYSRIALKFGSSSCAKLFPSRSLIKNQSLRYLVGTANQSNKYRIPEEEGDNIRKKNVLLSEQQQQPDKKSWDIESVKQKGMSLLETNFVNVKSQTKQRLLPSDEDGGGPSVRQIRESRRLISLMEDAINQYTSKKGNTFCIRGEPIVVVDAEVSPDMSQARIFWCLPFGLLSLKYDRSIQREVIRRMQIILDDKGGVLKGIVHGRLRMYKRSPNIRFVPADESLLDDLRNFM